MSRYTSFLRNGEYPWEKTRVYLEEYPECTKYRYPYDRQGRIYPFQSLAGMILMGPGWYTTTMPREGIFWEKLNLVLTAASLGTIKKEEKCGRQFLVLHTFLQLVCNQGPFDGCGYDYLLIPAKVPLSSSFWH